MVHIWIDGVPATGNRPALDVRDHAVTRGDGCFEAMRSYGGKIFAAGEHLDRLDRSAAALRLELPDRTLLTAWVTEAALVGGDSIIRLVVTRGNPTDPGVPAQVVVYAEPVPDRVDGLRVLPLAAPWHTAGVDWALAGVKSLSYAPNMSASRAAREEGFDDALLLSRDGVVLEGPTYSIAWVRDGRLETPSLDLGILASVTCRHVLAAAVSLGMETATGRFLLSRVEAADEVMALSTVKEVTPVVRVGSMSFEAGPHTAALRTAFAARRAADATSGVGRREPTR